MVYRIVFINKQPVCSGGGGIRTPGPGKPVNGFQDRRFQPLSHSSKPLTINAEREGFEPSIQLVTVYPLSRRALSASSATSPKFRLVSIILTDQGRREFSYASLQNKAIDQFLDVPSENPGISPSQPAKEFPLALWQMLPTFTLLYDIFSNSETTDTWLHSRFLIKEKCMTPSKLYYYKAYVTRVHSGDSCRVDIDMGFATWKRGLEIRLHKVQAPEIKGKTRDAGSAARDFLRSLIMDKEVLLRTVKDRVGRIRGYLGEIAVVTESGETIDVNAALIDAGHAIYQDAQKLMAD
jgi:micrococcal nuclease